MLCCRKSFLYLFVVCCTFYAPMRLLLLAYQKTSSMDRLYYFWCMLLIWLEDAEYQIKRLLTDGLKNMFSNTKDVINAVL